MRKALLLGVEKSPVVIRLHALARTDRPSSSWRAAEPRVRTILLLEERVAVLMLILLQVLSIEDTIWRPNNPDALRKTVQVTR